MRFSFAILVCLALAGAGCDDENNVSFYIAGHVAGEASGETGSCLREVTNPLVARGTFDVATPCGGLGDVGARRQYLLFPLYVNQIINRESPGPVRADPNGVFVQGAEVEIRDESGSALFPAFSVTASDFVPSALDDVESRDVGTLEIIPLGFGQMFADSVAPGTAQTVIVSVRAFGETNGDVTVESGEFLWPVDICNGCLYQEIPVGGETGSVLGCTPGQDEVSIVACPTAVVP